MHFILNFMVKKQDNIAKNTLQRYGPEGIRIYFHMLVKLSVLCV